MWTNHLKKTISYLMVKTKKMMKQKRKMILQETKKMSISENSKFTNLRKLKIIPPLNFNLKSIK